MVFPDLFNLNILKVTVSMTRCQDYLDTMNNNCDPSCKEPTKERMVRSIPRFIDLVSEQTDLLRHVR